MRAWGAAAFLLLWLGAAVACGGEDDAKSSYELSGKITDDLSGKKLTGVKITFTSDTRDTKSTKTDSDGYYEMTVRTDADFGQVRAEKAGYVPTEQTVYFDTKSRRIDIAMREALPDAGM